MMESKLFAFSAYLLMLISVMVLADSTDDTDTISLKSVSDTLLKMQNSLRILLSESNRQNQDLEMIKDDLGALKFGFAILQHTTNELSARSDELHYTLRKELKLSGNDTRSRLTILQEDMDSVRDCLETTKNDTKDRLAILQEDVNDIGVCVEVTKNDSRDSLVILSTIGYTYSNPAASCSDILSEAPQSASGQYWVQGTDSIPQYVFCDMDILCPNETEPTGWMRVASINMTDPSQSCPSGLMLRTNDIRRCGKDIDGPGCSSTTLSVQGVQYFQVCGMAIGYQDRSPDAFFPTGLIDSVYVDGISLTYGNPRNHVWTFAVGVHRHNSFLSSQCPCTNPGLAGQTPPPEFVGNDYFCETALDQLFASSFILHSDIPLWDGEGCMGSSTCCEFNNPPWFRKEISPSTSEDIEMRLCSDQALADEDINFEMLQLYIQ